MATFDIDALLNEAGEARKAEQQQREQGYIDFAIAHWRSVRQGLKAQLEDHSCFAEHRYARLNRDRHDVLVNHPAPCVQIKLRVRAYESVDRLVHHVCVYDETEQSFVCPDPQQHMHIDQLIANGQQASCTFDTTDLFMCSITGASHWCREGKCNAAITSADVNNREGTFVCVLSGRVLHEHGQMTASDNWSGFHVEARTTADGDIKNDGAATTGRKSGSGVVDTRADEKHQKAPTSKLANSRYLRVGDASGSRKRLILSGKSITKKQAAQSQDRRLINCEMREWFHITQTLPSAGACLERASQAMSLTWDIRYGRVAQYLQVTRAILCALFSSEQVLLQQCAAMHTTIAAFSRATREVAHGQRNGEKFTARCDAWYSAAIEALHEKQRLVEERELYIVKCEEDKVVLETLINERSDVPREQLIEEATSEGRLPTMSINFDEPPRIAPVNAEGTDPSRDARVALLRGHVTTPSRKQERTELMNRVERQVIAVVAASMSNEIDDDAVGVDNTGRVSQRVDRNIRLAARWIAALHPRPAPSMNSLEAMRDACNLATSAAEEVLEEARTPGSRVNFCDCDVLEAIHYMADRIVRANHQSEQHVKLCLSGIGYATHTSASASATLTIWKQTSATARSLPPVSSTTSTTAARVGGDRRYLPTRHIELPTLVGEYGVPDGTSGSVDGSAMGARISVNLPVTVGGGGSTANGNADGLCNVPMALLRFGERRGLIEFYARRIISLWIVLREFCPELFKDIAPSQDVAVNGGTATVGQKRQRDDATTTPTTAFHPTQRVMGGVYVAFCAAALQLLADGVEIAPIERIAGSAPVTVYEQDPQLKVLMPRYSLGGGSAANVAGAGSHSLGQLVAGAGYAAAVDSLQTASSSSKYSRQPVMLSKSMTAMSSILSPTQGSTGRKSSASKLRVIATMMSASADANSLVTASEGERRASIARGAVPNNSDGRMAMSASLSGASSQGGRVTRAQWHSIKILATAGELYARAILLVDHLRRVSPAALTTRVGPIIPLHLLSVSTAGLQMSITPECMLRAMVHGAIGVHDTSEADPYETLPCDRRHPHVRDLGAYNTIARSLDDELSKCKDKRKHNNIINQDQQLQQQQQQRQQSQLDEKMPFVDYQRTVAEAGGLGLKYPPPESTGAHLLGNGTAGTCYGINFVQLLSGASVYAAKVRLALENSLRNESHDVEAFNIDAFDIDAVGRRYEGRALDRVLPKFRFDRGDARPTTAKASSGIGKASVAAAAATARGQPSRKKRRKA